MSRNYDKTLIAWQLQIPYFVGNVFRKWGKSFEWHFSENGGKLIPPPLPRASPVNVCCLFQMETIGVIHCILDYMDIRGGALLPVKHL